MRNLFHITIILLFYSFSCFGQELNGAEYFWDNDPGEGNGFAISAVNGNFNSAIDQAIENSVNLTSGGLHLFHVRFQDDEGNWGPTYKRSIYLEESPQFPIITQAEYFWDADPGEGNGYPIVAFDGAFDDALESVFEATPTLVLGGWKHLFNIRIKDGEGNWGPLYKRTIVVETVPRDMTITYGEYFWDTDPGEGMGTPILAFDGAYDEAMESVFNNSPTLPAGGLHLFHIRLQNENVFGQLQTTWGPVYKRAIYIEELAQAPEIQAAEYFWDNDPGEGLATSLLAFDGAYDEAIEAVFDNSPALPSGGLHLFHVRVQDGENNWGPVYKRSIIVEGQIDSLEITSAEYFWDSDPGEGMGIPLLAFDGNFDEAIETVLDLSPTLTTGGLHLFHIRVRDADTLWGPVYKRAIYLEESPRTMDILAGEYFWGMTDPGQGAGVPILAMDGVFDEELEELFENSVYLPGPGLNLFNIRIQDENGEWGPVYKRVIYNDVPSDFLILSASSDSVCAGDSVLLIAEGAENYEWSIDGSTIISTNDSLWYTIDTTTTIICNGIDAFGYTDKDTVTITALFPIHPTITPIDTFYCEGSTAVPLSAIPSGGLFTGIGVSFNQFEPTVAGLGTHAIYYQADDVNGCTGYDTIQTIVGYIPSYDTIVNTSCDSYTVNGQTYTSTGLYDQAFTNILGCDSTLTVDVTIKYSSSSTITPTACNSYFSPGGNNYSLSGNYTETILNTVGCDSTITIDLIVNYNDSSELFVSECTQFIAPDGATYMSSGDYEAIIPASNGCDSVINLHLTIGDSYSSISEQSCVSYVSPEGNTYTTSGIYTDTISNSSGCDSIITIDLTINYPTTSTVNASAIDVYNLNGTDYYSSGTYQQVFPNQHGCDSTITLNLVIYNAGLKEETMNEVLLYPNPAKSKIYFEGINPSTNYSVTIKDTKGSTILSRSYIPLELEEGVEVSSFSPGTYFVELWSEAILIDIFKLVVTKY